MAARRVALRALGAVAHAAHVRGPDELFAFVGDRAAVAADLLVDRGVAISVGGAAARHGLDGRRTAGAAVAAAAGPAGAGGVISAAPGAGRAADPARANPARAGRVVRAVLGRLEPRPRASAREPRH